MYLIDTGAPIPVRDTPCTRGLGFGETDVRSTIRRGPAVRDSSFETNQLPDGLISLRMRRPFEYN